MSEPGSRDQQAASEGEPPEVLIASLRRYGSDVPLPQLPEEFGALLAELEAGTPQRAPKPAAWLPALDSLEPMLRAAGFSVGPDRWLNIADLLTQLLEQNALPRERDAIGNYLGPLICRNRTEQTQFRAVLCDWWRRCTPQPEVAPPPVVSDPIAQQQRSLAWLGWRSAALCAVVLLVIAGGTFLYVDRRAAGEIAKVEAAAEKGTAVLNNDVVRAQGERLPIKSLPPRQPIETNLPPLPAPRDDNPFLAPFAAAALQVANVLAFAWLPGLVALLLWRSWLGQLVLRRAQADPDQPPQLTKLKLGHDPLFDGQKVRDALRRLHTAVESPTRRLDIERTVAATARRAGLFVPVRAWRAYLPDVLLWVNHRGRNDPVLALAWTLTARLRACDLAVSTYSYRVQPDRLLELRTGQWHTRGAVLAQHRGSRLIVIGNAEGLIDVWTAAPLPWVAEVRAESGAGDLVLLEPAARGHALGKELREAGVLLAPLNSAGLAQVVAEVTGGEEHTVPLPRPLPAALRDAERLRLPVALPRAQVHELLAVLRSYLDERGLHLLTAAAAYPEFHWPLVRALDVQLYPDESPDPREVRLLQMAQLPWSRDGWLPDWLRLSLLRRLSSEQRWRLREEYRLLVERTTQRATDEVVLPIRWDAPRRTPGAYVRQLFNFGPRPGPLEDAVFVEFMLGGRFSRLDFELTRAWERVLPGASLRTERGRWTVGLAATVLALLSGFGWLSWGAPWSAQQLARREVLKDVPLRVIYEASTAQLAQQLEQTLRGTFIFEPMPPGSLPEPIVFYAGAAAAIVYEPGWGAQAQWLADRVAYASYGAPVAVLDSRDPVAQGLPKATGPMQLWLRRPNQAGHVFSDALSRPFSDEAWERELAGVRAPEDGARPDTTDPEIPSPIPLSTFRDALRDGGQGPVMVVIPAGEFMMGSPAAEVDRFEDEGSQHKVALASFALAETEVTFDAYDRFAKATNRPLPSDEGRGRGSRPVINVTWNDANAYASWLSQQTGQTYRLPSEAEWEYAARAGTRTPFSTGDCISALQANFDDAVGYGSCPTTGKSANQTQPVGTYPANPFNLRDVHGNVYEWVEDCYHENYDGAPVDGRAWLAQGGADCARRVVRGGSWNNFPRSLRSAGRLWYTVDGANIVVGFRLARTLDTK